MPYQGQHQISRAVSTLPSEEKQAVAPPMCQCGVPKIVRVVSCCSNVFCHLFLSHMSSLLGLRTRFMRDIINNIQVNKLGPNLGREFFCCPKPMDSQCQVLKFLDQVKIVVMCFLFQGQFQWADEPLPPMCSCGKPKVKSCDQIYSIFQFKFGQFQFGQFRFAGQEESIQVRT